MIEENVTLESLTTDRHSQIRKHIRENTDIRHQFDIWHAAKSLKKKLTKAAKLKANAELKPWIKSIDNHFWWCCLTCNGSLEALREKWLSILNHIWGSMNSQTMTFLNVVSMGILTENGYRQLHPPI